MEERERRTIAVWVWTAIPLLIQFWIVMEYRTDLIIRDEFRHILPRVQHFLDGGFSFYADVWENQNVHRPVLPVLFILANASLAGWNVLSETLVGFLGYVVLLGVLARELMRTSRALGVEAVNWTIPVVSFLLFSMTSWKVFYMGYAALQHGFAILGVVAGLFVLSRPVRPLRSLVYATLLGLMATLSFGTAIVFWPAGFFVLLCKEAENLGRRLLHLGIWIAITFLVVSVYMQDMAGEVTAISRRPFLAVLKSMLFSGHLGENIEFTLAYVGAPICNYSVTGAVIAGLGGVDALGVLTLAMLWRRRIAFSVLVPYLALGLFSLAGGFLTSVGRLRYSVETVLGRDWKIFATPLWIALVVLIYLTLRSMPKEEGARGKLERARSRLDLSFSVALPALMAIAMLSFWSTNFTEIELYESRHFPLARLNARLTNSPIPTAQRIPSFRHGQTMRQKRAERVFVKHVATLPDKPITFNELKLLHEKVDEEGMASRFDFLRRHKLTIFRE